MLRISLALLSVSITVYLVSAQTDYCAKGLCGTATHIACNNKGAWASTCPKSPAPFLIDMNLSLRQHLVRLHNVRRNNLALGRVIGYSSARRMATMRWSPELAKLAELNVHQCQMKHDACHNTNKFKSSGQNLALIPRSSQNNELHLTTCINLWWSENRNASMTAINSYPSTWPKGVIGHFTAMAQQPNYAVGCAAGVFAGKFLLACNYATTNFVGRPVYVRGPTAAGCNTGVNVNYPGLCKVAETFTV